MSYQDICASATFQSDKTRLRTKVMGEMIDFAHPHFLSDEALAPFFDASEGIISMSKSVEYWDGYCSIMFKQALRNNGFPVLISDELVGDTYVVTLIVPVADETLLPDADK